MPVPFEVINPLMSNPLMSNPLLKEAGVREAASQLRQEVGLPGQVGARHRQIIDTSEVAQLARAVES